VTDRPMRPWEVRRAAERAEQMAMGQEILARAARAIPHLTDAERAEAERLIALPYASESNALRNFVLEHSEACPS
jgi:hypothetical protein